MKKIAIHALALSLVLFPRFVFAASCGNTGPGLNNPLAFCTIEDFLIAVLGLVAQIVFPIIVLFIVFIGFRFVQHSASGDAEGLKEDRKYFVWAIVGALIVLAGQALAYAIQATVGELTP